MNQDQSVVEAFGALTAVNESEDVVTFSSLWQKETAVLVFVRHFG